MPKTLKVLITSGGTYEHLDGVRIISNISSGRTGAAVAQHLCRSGLAVHLLHGKGSLIPRWVDDDLCSCEQFTTFSDLDKKLRRILAVDTSIKAVIHLAAVSDFSPQAIIYDDGRVIPPSSSGKILSNMDFSVRFTRNYKIIDRLKEYAKEGNREDELLVIGYKLTHTSDAEKRTAAVQELLARGVCDLVVHNDLSEIAGEQHRASYYGADGSILGISDTKQGMGERLFRYITGEQDDIMH